MIKLQHTELIESTYRGIYDQTISLTSYDIWKIVERKISRVVLLTVDWRVREIIVEDGLDVLRGFRV